MSSVIRPSLISRKYEGVTHARGRQDLSTGTNMADRLFRKWSRVPGDIRDASSVRCPESLPETLAVLSRMLCRGVRESREGKASAPRYSLPADASKNTPSSVNRSTNSWIFCSSAIWYTLRINCSFLEIVCTLMIFGFVPQIYSHQTFSHLI